MLYGRDDRSTYLVVLQSIEGSAAHPVVLKHEPDGV